jgi:TolA-binding protein
MKDCGGELLGRVRSGVASEQDKTAFDAHWMSCESCRMTLEVMDDFDALGEAESGDGERVARMSARVVATLGKPARMPVRLAVGPWLLMVAAVAFAGVAIAGGAYLLTHRTVAQAPPPLSAAPTIRTPHPTVEVQTERLDASPDQEVEGGNDASVPQEPAAFVKAQVSAAALYRAANDARRGGNPALAIGSYQRLQQQYPGSAEARASRVSLGGSLLKSGSAAAALAQFDAYLASGGGQLTAEALFGRAQALRALGRSAEEVQNLRLLVGSYPDSAYATHAKRRLQELH